MRELKEELAEKYKLEANLQGLEFLNRIKNGFGIYRKIDCGHEFQYQITAVRSLYKQNAKPRCPICLEEYKRKCENEANVEQGIHKYAGNYSFKRKSCGHSITVSYDYLESHKDVICSQCEIERMNEEATASNLEIIGRDGQEYIYKLPCGHTKTISGRCVRSGGYRCKECYEEKVKLAALDFGFEYIGESNKGAHYRLCKIIECGHFKDVQIHDITGRPRKGICKECVEQKHKEEAIAADLHLIGMPNNCNPNYRKYKTNCCGSEHDFMITHVRRNSYTCPTCGDSHLDNYSNLYLYKMTYGDFSWIKFGFSNNVDRRLVEYNLLEGTTSDLIKTVRVSTGRKAVKIEKSLHVKYKKFKLESDKMKKFFLVSGFNECYPEAMLDTLLEELERIKNE